MKKIIHSRVDGGVSVVTPFADEGMTEDQALQRAMALLPPDALDPQIIDDSELPQDRAQRDRWTRVDGAVVVGTGT